MHGCRVRSWVWLRCSPSCLCLPQFHFLSHIRIPSSGDLESISVCTDLCIFVVISVSLGILFASCPSGRHFYHICRQASHLLNFKHNIFWWPVYSLRLRCECVICLAPSVQFVFLFFTFVRPLLVFWVVCCFVEVVLFATVLFVVFFGFQEFWLNSDLKSSNGSVPRRSNLST